MQKEINHLVLFLLKCQLERMADEKFYGVLNSEGLLKVFWMRSCSLELPWGVVPWVSIVRGVEGKLKLNEIEFAIAPALPINFCQYPAFEQFSILENYYGRERVVNVSMLGLKAVKPRS